MNDNKQYYRFYNTEDPNRWGRSEMPEQLGLTRHWLSQAGMIDPEKVVCELGCGIGALSGIHTNYVGLDFSFVALKRKMGDAKVINGDMQLLPLKDESVDCIFSWAALEHVPNPERVLAEVGRVLKVGGIIFLAPAWNVRPWAAKALPIRSYREARSLSKCPLVFDYKRLTPNLEEYIYTDCDAFTSMDAHAAIMFFKSRNWTVLSHRGLFARILARHEPVVLQKARKA